MTSRSSEPAAAAANEPLGAETTGEPRGAETTVALPADVDLHARPAAQFVRAAMGFRARIAIAANEREADAKSLLSVLSLGARRGTVLRLRAEGDDAVLAVGALADCLAGLRE